MSCFALRMRCWLQCCFKPVFTGWFLYLLSFAATTEASAETSTGSIVLAQTTVCQVTAADLANQILCGKGLNSEADKVQESTGIADSIKTEAYEQILLHLAEKQQLQADPRFKAELDLLADDFLLKMAINELIEIPSQPSADELQEYITSATGALKRQPVVTWQHLLFEVGLNQTPRELAEAYTSASLARAIIASGESFETAGRMYRATKDSGLVPGHPIGPLALDKSIFPELADVLAKLPVGTLGEVTTTPLGMLVVNVLARDVPPLSRRDRWQIGADYLTEKRNRYKARLLDNLRMRYPVSYSTVTFEDASTTEILVQIGERKVTKENILTRSRVSSDPANYLTTALTPTGLKQLVEEQLLLSVMDEKGVTTSPEVRQKLEWRARFRTVEEMLWRTEKELAAKPTEVDLNNYLHTNSKLFATDLFSLEIVSISLKSLAVDVGSTYGLHLQRAAESLLNQWNSGQLTSASLAKKFNPGVEAAKTKRYTNSMAQELPMEVRETAQTLQPGDSAIAFGKGHVHLIRMRGRERNVPQLSKIRSSVMASYQKEHSPDSPSREQMLELYDFKFIVRPEAVKWDSESQTLTVPSH